ncbi:MAG: hypothetical protein D6820_15495, partial [Lentisphaerae bacterium]
MLVCKKEPPALPLKPGARSKLEKTHCGIPHKNPQQRIPISLKFLIIEVIIERIIVIEVEIIIERIIV